MKIPHADCKDAIYEAAGSDLFTQMPLMRDWIMSLYPGRSFTLGSYAYLDGATINVIKDVTIVA